MEGLVVRLRITCRKLPGLITVDVSQGLPFVDVQINLVDVTLSLLLLEFVGGLAIENFQRRVGCRRSTTVPEGGPSLSWRSQLIIEAGLGLTLGHAGLFSLLAGTFGLKR